MTVIKSEFETGTCVAAQDEHVSFMFVITDDEGTAHRMYSGIRSEVEQELIAEFSDIDDCDTVEQMMDEMLEFGASTLLLDLNGGVELYRVSDE